MNILKETGEEIPWQTSGEDSAVSLPRAHVQSLVRELVPTSHVAQQKKKKKKIIKINNIFKRFSGEFF